MNFVYIQLLKYLRLLRLMCKGDESLAEDELLDTMDLVWGLMTEEDKKGLESHPLYNLKEHGMEKPLFDQVKEIATPNQHSFKRLYVRVTGNIGENRFFLYDTDPHSPLAPQIAGAVEAAQTEDLKGLMFDPNDSTTFVGLVTRNDDI